MFRLGVDIGGTFTDFALLDLASGRIATYKRLTTPYDPSIAVLEGLDDLLRREVVPIDRVAAVVHGTTLVTNAVIERRGAVTGMLVTSGFREVLDVAKETRYDLFDLRLRYAEPLIPRPLRAEIAERVRYDGEIQLPVDLAAARDALAGLVERNRIEAVAVCFLHSYANPAHESAVKAMIEREFPALHVTASHEITSVMREFERWTTATVNACTQPMVDRYLAAIEAGLAARGFRGRFHLMTSNGGTITAETARRFPVRLMESGPAAGILMCGHHGRDLGISELLSFDMGGTTSKGALLTKGAPLKNYELEVARVHHFKRGSGLPLRIPVIDMIEIGTGGGSIARRDRRGALKLGPQSAGARPGPAGYGLGGVAPTLTDASLVLGYLDPRFFLGGKMALDADAAGAAVERDVAAPLGLDRVRAAWGIYETAVEDVSRAFRVHAAERGFDYRDCSMVAFGGMGPLHALRIARKLRIPRVVLPAGAGVMSAFGLLVTPMNNEAVRTDPVFLDDLTADDFDRRLAAIEEEAARLLDAAGIASAEITMLRRLDIRYRGQGYQVEVALPEGLRGAAALAAIPALFKTAYEKVFAISFGAQPLEIVDWKVEAVGPAPSLPDAGFHLADIGRTEGAALKGHRAAFSPDSDGFVDHAVYDRYALRPGDRLAGPALVEDKESTCLVGGGDSVVVDERHNLVATIVRPPADAARETEGALA